MKPKKKAPRKSALRRYFEAKTSDNLSRSNKHIIALANRAGVSVETVYRATLGDRLPGLPSARKIAAATNPKISAFDMVRF